LEEQDQNNTKRMKNMQRVLYLSIVFVLLLEIFVVQSKGDHGRVNSGKKSHVTEKDGGESLKLESHQPISRTKRGILQKVLLLYAFRGVQLPTIPGIPFIG